MLSVWIRRGALEQYAVLSKMWRRYEVKEMDDLIRREYAIGVIEGWFQKIGLNPEICVDAIKALPSEKTELKNGKWIPQDHNKKTGCVTTLMFYYPKCSECGHTGEFGMNFCPQCGADMRGGQE